MKIVTIVGTRPEIIRLSRIIPLIDQFAEHLLVHTGQNYDPKLRDVFFEDLGVRRPDVDLAIGPTAGFAAQTAAIFEKTGDLLAHERPDRVLILGDTNSGLSAVVAARLGIPVFHMEAGNRCFDDRVPEEINRRVIDHSSSVLMPYTERSKDNLVREGIERERIFVTGNPIFEVLRAFDGQVSASGALRDCGVPAGGYFLATIHRAENVDESERLAKLLQGLAAVGREHGLPVLVSVHPRTADKIRRFHLAADGLRMLEPFRFFDFVALEKHARVVLSDSGTVQEECAILGVPSVTVRDVTERAETIECGANILSGADPEDLKRAVAVALTTGSGWVAPPEYTVPDVSRTVAKILLGYVSRKAHGATLR